MLAPFSSFLLNQESREKRVLHIDQEQYYFLIFFCFFPFFLSLFHQFDCVFIDQEQYCFLISLCSGDSPMFRRFHYSAFFLSHQFSCLFCRSRTIVFLDIPLFLPFPPFFINLIVCLIDQEQCCFLIFRCFFLFSLSLFHQLTRRDWSPDWGCRAAQTASPALRAWRCRRRRASAEGHQGIGRGHQRRERVDATALARHGPYRSMGRMQKRAQVGARRDQQSWTTRGRRTCPSQLCSWASAWSQSRRRES